MKRRQKFPLLFTLLLIVGVLFLLYLIARNSPENTSTPSEETIQTAQNTPASCPSMEYTDLIPYSEDEIIKHTYYTLGYSEQHEQAAWVYYELTPEMVNGTATRSDKFREDPFVSTGSATLADYRSSGYDRGHLCPAASMSINQKAMDESFYLSNMSPQFPSFNRGGWKKLEELVRNWAISEQQLYVISGPILKDGLKTIGGNQVSVPEQYYKIIYSPQKNKMIAFLMPNATITLPLTTYAVPVDSIETLSRIDFFRALPDSLENILERQADTKKWNFQIK